MSAYTPATIHAARDYGIPIRDTPGAALLRTIHGQSVRSMSSRADALRYILYACPGTDSRARSSPCSVSSP